MTLWPHFPGKSDTCTTLGTFGKNLGRVERGGGLEYCRLDQRVNKIKFSRGVSLILLKSVIFSMHEWQFHFTYKTQIKVKTYKRKRFANIKICLCTSKSNHFMNFHKEKTVTCKYNTYAM